MTTPRVLIRTQVGDKSSYAFHGEYAIRGLRKRGWEVAVVPINREAWKVVLPRDIAEVTYKTPPWVGDIEFIIYPAKVAPWNKHLTVWKTMWETTRMPQNWVPNLNGCLEVMVPTVMGASLFSAQGVTSPLTVVPMGIKTDVFKPQPFVDRSTVVYGTSGITSHGWPRKGFDEVLEAFEKAFPVEAEDDVELWCKCYPGDPLPPGLRNHKDKRIKVTEGRWTDEKLAKWYEEIDVFVCASKGEGWGLMPHEAGAVGRPSIVPLWLGFSGFLNESNCYPVAFDLVEASGDTYSGHGHWVSPSVDSIAGKMMEFYAFREFNRVLDEHPGSFAEKTRRFSIDNMVGGYDRILRKHLK